MKCYYCGSDTKVIDSRPSEDGFSIKRRRECLKCGRRFNTFESIETSMFYVIKRDGSREAFDSEKLKRGIIKACEKRPISIEVIDQMVEDIKRHIANTLDQEVTSKEIGELVMSKLKDIDEIAYIRFASVYREFKDVSSFMSAIETILGDKGKK